LVLGSCPFDELLIGDVMHDSGKVPVEIVIRGPAAIAYAVGRHTLRSVCP
jgi:hypothetical protein